MAKIKIKVNGYWQILDYVDIPDNVEAVEIVEETIEQDAVCIEHGRKGCFHPFKSSGQGTEEVG